MSIPEDRGSPSVDAIGVITFEWGESAPGVNSEFIETQFSEKAFLNIVFFVV